MVSDTESVTDPAAAAHLAVNFLLGMPVRASGPAYTAVKVAQNLRAPGITCRIAGHPDLWPGPLEVPHVGRAPLPGERLAARSDNPRVKHLLREVGARQLLRWLRDTGTVGQAVYTWGETSLATVERLKSLDVPTIREKFNCAKRVAREILDSAYDSLGAVQSDRMSDAMIAKEVEEMALADAVFSPSPMVTRSLIEIGVPPDKVMSASYGWDPERFQGTDKALPPSEAPTFVFVGYVCVRKGAHTLLEAWRRAGMPGRLVLVGRIEPLIADRYRDMLDHPSVHYLPFTASVGAVFRSADWFVFPSLEEGSPLVTYEAGGCGLPLIVSEMGAGGFARDGIEGQIVRSTAADVWADALARLALDDERRVEWGANALTRAADFTWDKVGAQRASLLLQRFAD